MNSPRAKRHARWLVPAALFALAPKCLLCLLAYAGVGAALGIGGPELCGANDGQTLHWSSWLAVIVISGIALVAIAGVMQRSRAATVAVSSENRKNHTR